MPRIPLPPELQHAAIRTSRAREFGLTRSRLRGRDVDHPHHGVSATGLDLTAVHDRCIAFLPVLQPGQAFSHTTALALAGAPLPASGSGVHISVAFPRTPPRRPGVHGHALARLPTRMLGLLPVVPAPEAWAQAATLLSREDLTAVADFLLAAGDSPEVLARVAGEWTRRPGAARVAWAATRARPGVRSRPETHLRLLVTSSRLPEPVVAPPVPVANGLVLHPDLAYPERRLALEYEGDGHRDSRRWASDIERRELLPDAGWRTIRVTAHALYRQRDAVVARIRAQLRG